MSAAKEQDVCSACGYPRTRTECARCLYVEPEDRDPRWDNMDAPVNDPLDGLPDPSHEDRRGGGPIFTPLVHAFLIAVALFLVGFLVWVWT